MSVTFFQKIEFYLKYDLSYLKYIWIEGIKSSYCFDLYNYLDKSCYILHIYQQQKLHVTDLTNRYGHDFACDGHDIHMQKSCPSRKIVTDLTVTDMTAQNVFQS